jgi:hypothetical protein
LVYYSLATALAIATATTTHVEKLLFRSMNRVEGKVIEIFDINNDFDTTDHIEDGASPRRYGYSTTTIDGEFILLFRSAYRVNRMYRVSVLSSTVLLLGPESVYNDKDYTIAIMQLVVLNQGIFKKDRLAYQVDIMYQTYTVLSPTVILLQSGPVYNDDVHDDPIAFMQLGVRYQDRSIDDSHQWFYSDTSTDGEMILLF